MNTILTKTEGAMLLIEEALNKWKDKVAVFCSFGKDSMVVLHLSRRLNPDVQVISVMTRFKPKETFAYLNKIKREWKLNLKIYQTDEIVSDSLPLTNPDLCCHINKELPTQRALHNFDAWITGLRRTEGRTRKDFEYVEESSRSYMGEQGIITKINPILDWYEMDIWKYMAIHSIPVHPWYAAGYRSLGCDPCTHLVNDDETERAGRWKDTSKCGGECGIHTMHKG